MKRCEICCATETRSEKRIVGEVSLASWMYAAIILRALWFF